MRNIWHNIVVAAAVALVFAAPACKTEEGNSIYEIVPLREKTRPETDGKSDYDVPRELIAHIFLDVKGANWKPLSYEDALAGVLSDTVSDPHQTLYADATFAQDDNGNLLVGDLQGGRRHYLIAVDEEDTIYAWRELSTVGDAGTIYLNIYFRPWREAKTPAATYTETGWTIVNKYVVPDEEEGEGAE